MTQKRKNSLPTGRGERKAPTTGGQAGQKLEEDINLGADSMNGDVGGNLDIMDTAVIAMVNLYLKSIPLSERCSILESVVRQRNTEDEPGIKAHIDGAKLADLIDKAKAYLAELLNVKRTAHSSSSAPLAPHEEQPVETVFGIDMSNTSQHGMINTLDYSDGVYTEPAAEDRVVRVDDIDDDAPKYNPELEMSFDNLINKSWMVLFDLMRNLSGTEYVTHMPYEMAEMIVKHYYKLM